MNGEIVSKADYDKLMATHQQQTSQNDVSNSEPDIAKHESSSQALSERKC